MNPILFVRIRPLLSLLAFAISTSTPLLLLVRSSSTVCTSVYVRVYVRAYAIVWEQVRRRLKGRQPGGRRLSKGFRLVPPT